MEATVKVPLITTLEALPNNNEVAGKLKTAFCKILKVQRKLEDIIIYVKQ